MEDRETVNIRVVNVDQTLKLGEIIGKSLEPGSIIALKGDLGAGKTVLVKGIAKGLGVEDDPPSPTFVIMNEYEGRMPLYHFDLYRLSSADELFGIGYEEFFFGGGVTVVEWADRISEVFPEDRINIEIKTPNEEGDTPETVRSLTIEGNRKWVLSFKNTAEQALRT